MALSPIAFIAPNYRDFKNYWLKAYETGTTTPKSMALDDQGAVTVAKLELNKDGFIESAGGALVIPYIDGAYDAWLFPTEAEADANNTVNAERVADNITGGVTQEILDDAILSNTINDLSQAYNFKTVALMKASLIIFPIGKKIFWQGYYAESDGGSNWGIVKSGAHTDDGGSTFTLADGQYVSANLKGRKISVKKFGAKGDDTQTDDPFINSALATGLNIHTPNGTYKCEDTLNVQGHLSGEGEESLFKFYGANISPLINKLVPGNLSNFSVDAANVTECQYGVYIEADYEPIREEYDRITVTNLANTTTSCNGIILVRFSDDLAIRGNFYFEKCTVKNISGSAVAKGIIVSFNNESQSNLTIRSCEVEDVTPATDGDGIHIVTAAHTDPTKDDYQALIENCHVQSSVPMKRCYKVQWHNAKVKNNIAIGDNVSIGYDTYADGSVFDGNTYVETTGGLEAYNCFDALGTIISNATIVMNSSVSQAMRFSGSCSVKLSNVDIKYKGIAAGDTLGIIQATDSADLQIVNLTLTADNQEGCGILQGGTSTVSLGGNSIINGPKFGHRDNLGSGSCKISGSTQIFNVVFGVQAFGENGFDYNIVDSFISASSVALYTQSTGNRANLKIDRCEVETLSNGILGLTDDVVTNCRITNTGAQSGVGIVTKTGGQASGNVITNFSTGIQYTNSTNTIIDTNTTIDCAAQFLKSGSVDFVFHNNNNR